MSNDPYAGYVGADVNMVQKAMAAIFPKYTVELVAEGTNPAPGAKPLRMRVYYNTNTRKVSRVVAG